MTKCSHCGTDLRKLPSVHSVLGYLYCSKECAISAGIDEILNNAGEEAKKRYNDNVEVVATTEIGLHGPGFEHLIQYIELEASCDYTTALNTAIKVVDAVNKVIGEVLPL